MIKRQRYYDGYGNELRIDEVRSGTLKVSINRNSIEVPIMKMFEMLKDTGAVSGKHVKQNERKAV